MFASVLVANRGEIACRVIRTLRRMGIRSVAIHSEADERAKHVREADVAAGVGPAPAASSYLNASAIVEAALRSGAEAVHPGYGFLSERPAFAQAVRDAGLGWIGPSPDVLELTGDKVAARVAMARAGFPVLPGAGPFTEPGEVVAASVEIGFPVMVKAVAGGGGIGMGIARDGAELAGVAETARARAERSFGDPAVYLERYVDRARHVEVQVLADDDRTIHLYERECSVQRRHQKVIEESPSAALGPAGRLALCNAAVDAMLAIGYRNAGTVECVMTPEGKFFFLEVNARIQVEHPVTEMLTGVDLVEQQLRIAAGAGMSLERTPPRHGHAIELRIYAEDPGTFLPSPGRITRLELSSPSDARRLDLGYDEGDDVPMHYDPLIGKVIVRAEGRDAAIREAPAALPRIEGVKTNIPRLRQVLSDDRFRTGDYDTGLLGQ